jgi:hypothetical protein
MHLILKKEAASPAGASPQAALDMKCPAEVYHDFDKRSIGWLLPHPVFSGPVNYHTAANRAVSLVRMKDGIIQDAT